jgi:hypothetical protein
VNEEELVDVHRDGWFVRAAGMVGDLGSPYYREERQRDVWNEAAAVGLQVVLWLGLGAAAAMVWSRCCGWWAAGSEPGAGSSAARSSTRAAAVSRFDWLQFPLTAGVF